VGKNIFQDSLSRRFKSRTFDFRQKSMVFKCLYCH